MNKLQMNSFGVQELNAEDVLELDGGWFGPFGAGANLAWRLGSLSAAMYTSANADYLESLKAA